MTTKRNRKVKRKSLLNFICPCIVSNSDEINEQNYVLIDDKDKYEYVIEKLAIKKIPLSVFATEDDYKHLDEEYGEGNRTKMNQLFSGGNANYQSYFVQMRNRNRSSPPRIETTTSTSSTDDNLYCPQHGNSPKLKMPASPKQEKKEMVTSILNKYSSLYTLDDKETIPKDPLSFPMRKFRAHSPTCPTVMTPRMEVPRIPMRNYTHESHAVEIHEPPQKENSEYQPMPPLPGAMTRQMRQTINALGTAQPFAKRMVPRNNRGPSPPVRDDPLQNVKTLQSEEIRCVSYENDTIKPVFYNSVKRTSKKGQYEDQKRILLKKYEDTPSSKQESFISEKSSNTNHYVLLSSMSYQSLPKVIEEENCVTKLPSNFSIGDKRIVSNSISEQSYTTVNKDAGSKYNSDEPIMEINHMKGKNLKWKIIIKHHDDNDRK